MNRLHKVLQAISVVLAIGILSAATTKAVVVTVDSQQYDVTTISGTYNGLSSTLQSQPWWGSVQRADSFAIVVGDQLGMPNTIGFDFGPYFVFELSGLRPSFEGQAFLSSQPLNPVNVSDGLDVVVTFAVVAPPGVADSGVTIAMFAAALGGLVVFCRRSA